MEEQKEVFEEMKEKLTDLLKDVKAKGFWEYGTDRRTGETGGHDMTAEDIADYLLENGVTVQECAYWQYIDDDVDEDNNIQAYCSVCHAGDKHATSMIGKVPYCWKCGRKMMPQPPKGE